MTTDSAPHAPLSGRYAVVLAIASALILLLGLFLRPTRSPDAHDAELPSQTELERLARMAQRRVLENEMDFFAALGRDLAGSVRLVPDLGTTAIVWEAGVLLTAALDAPLPATLTVNGTRGPLLVERRTGGPQAPVALLRHDPSIGLAAVERAEGVLAPGAQLVVVWQGPAGRGVAPALFVGVRPRACGQVRGEEAVTTLALDRALAGAGVFDLDQRLVAVVLSCGDGFAAITTTSVAVMAAAAAAEASTPAGTLVQRFGIKVSAMRETDARLFGLRSAGLYVEEVWDAYRAATRFEPGDVIETLDGTPIGSLADLVTRATAQSPQVIGLRRGTRRLNVPLATLDSESSVAGQVRVTGVSLSPPLAAIIDHVPAGTPAARAGLRSGDRILSVNGARLADRDLSEILAGTTPALLTVARPGRRLAVIVR